MMWTKFLLVLILPLSLLGVQPGPARADVPLAPTDDSFVRDKIGMRNSNFDGHSSQILVSASGFPVGVPVDIGYLRFDLSGVQGHVSAVRLRLYDQVKPGPDVTVAVYSTTSDDWNGSREGLGDETTLTFNNAPGEGRLLDQQVGASQPAWMEFDGAALTDYVAGQIAGDRIVTLRVKIVSTRFIDAVHFEDRENGGETGNMPELVLEATSADSMLYLPLVMNWALSD